jgi:hypothetical protein
LQIEVPSRRLPGANASCLVAQQARFQQTTYDSTPVGFIPEVLIPEVLIPEVLIPEVLIPEVLIPEVLGDSARTPDGRRSANATAPLGDDQ